jgi:transposase
MLRPATGHGLVAAMCPALLEQPGIGPVTAAVTLIAWSHHGRVRSEAALAGVSPVPAGSGRTVRHRLNAAIQTIAKFRQRYDRPTQDYYTARRTAEGRTPRETTRILKRCVARQIWRIIEASS